MRNRTELYYFSPTGGTKKAGMLFCKAFAHDVKTVNLGLRDAVVQQPESDVVVIAAPVFAGRIPAIVTQKLHQLDGNGKIAITLAVYGNRAYEDALLELNDLAAQCGFHIVASAALIAQHSMVPEVAKGRPDDVDAESIAAFAQRVLDKLETGTEHPVRVPGNSPYKESAGMTATPVSLPCCNQCGKCVDVCPTGAIRLEQGETDAELCILCMACVAACPKHARILPPPLQQGLEQKLGALKTVRRENEYFL